MKSSNEKIFWIREAPPVRYSETISLSPIAMCAHQRLYWSCFSKQPLIDDNASLARIAGLKLAQWKRVRKEVEPHFIVDDSGWYHEGIMQELSLAVEKYKKRADAGRKGGETKAKNNKPPLETTAGDDDEPVEVMQ